MRRLRAVDPTIYSKIVIRGVNEYRVMTYIDMVRPCTLPINVLLVYGNLLGSAFAITEATGARGFSRAIIRISGADIELVELDECLFMVGVP